MPLVVDSVGCSAHGNPQNTAVYKSVSFMEGPWDPQALERVKAITTVNQRYGYAKVSAN